MQFKEGVKIKGVSAEVVIAMCICKDIFNAFKASFIVTSVMDGKHSDKSLHYKGEAFDIRTKHILSLETKKDIVREIKYALTDEFDVVFENIGEDQEHIHLEFDPK